MIFRLPTFSNAALSVLLCCGIVPMRAATATGKVQLSTVKGARAAEGAAVWLVPVQGRAPIPAPQTARVLQRGKRFIPHVSVIGVGWTVDWPNLDPIFHNAFSNFAGQMFDTGLYPPGGTQKIRFQREGVVRVFCNIHATMSAVVVVSPSPWFAATKRDGSYSIAEVPPGEYILKVWHERVPEAELRSSEKRISIAGDTAVDLIALAETGYVTPAPHKNKYGREYPPEPPVKAGYEQGPQSGRSR